MNTDLYVLLIFDGRYLFIPQHEVESVEIISDVQITDTFEGVVGWFFGHGLESPVYSLGSNLALVLEVSEKREYLVLLKAEAQPVGILCDEVENVNFQKELLHPQDLHIMMTTANSPISQLLNYQDKKDKEDKEDADKEEPNKKDKEKKPGQMACICSGGDLVKYLSVLSKQLSVNDYD